MIRHYKRHTRASAEGVTLVQYAKNRVALKARQDFFKLALEALGGNGGPPGHSTDGDGSDRNGPAGNGVSSGEG